MITRGDASAAVIMQKFSVRGAGELVLGADHGGRGGGQCIVIPPLTDRVWPVI
jgi:hypothetical protein